MSDIEYIVVGLGNPGKEYDNTRHNIGFMALDFVAKNLDFTFNNQKFKSLYAISEFSGKKVLFLKPQTYMNLSGQALIAAMNFYKVKPEKVIVIFDDISLPVGKIRIRAKGSHGGHNGMKNIIGLSGSNNFLRIKIGVGEKPNPNWDLANWVLSKFSSDEIKILDSSIQNCFESLRLIVSGKIVEAMNKFN